MTWYANRIYINATPEALVAVRSEPSFAGHLFLLTGSLPVSTRRGVPELRLPDRGLLVIKEIGSGTEQEGEPPKHWWYAPDEWLSWSALQGPRDQDVIDPSNIQELAEVERPPLAFLRYLRALHVSCNSPVTYYASFMWGGDVESEYAWVFAEHEVVYCDAPAGAVEVDADGNRHRLTDRGVLESALAHHGLDLPTAYFPPHTRKFDWDTRRLR
jgi:hypothetical protein